ncbi:MAG: hypothetical protein AAAC47_14805 [Pararhizobium sp.]
MPNFSILGMLLGGRGYASNWFGNRDELAIKESERAAEAQNRQNSVNTLTGGPEWKQAMADPYNRERLGGLWARGNQADIDPKTGNTVDNLFTSGMQHIYGREGQDYAAGLNREAQLFGQKIAQENVLFSNQQDQLNARQKRADENAAMMAGLEGAFGKDNPVIASIIQGKMLKDSGIDVDGMPQMVNGQLVSVPVPGTKLFDDRVQPIVAQGQLTGMIDMVTKSFDTGSIVSQGELSNIRGFIQEAYRKSTQAGTPDAGLKAMLDELFPSNLDFQSDPRMWGQYKEKWRTAQMVQKQKLGDMQKYAFLPMNVQNTPFGGVRRDPKEAANELNAQQGANQKLITGPQPNPNSRGTGVPAAKPKSGAGGRGAGTFWDSNPTAKTRGGGSY